MQNNIQDARVSYGLVVGKYTQEDAARDFCVSLGTYRNWEQGVGKLNGEILSAIADKYGCSVDYLLCRTTDPRPYTPHAYVDSRQTAINGYYESMAEDGKDTLLKVARGLAKDAANRIEKTGGERSNDTSLLGA